MKTLFTFALLILIQGLSYGQNYASNIDSITKNYISKLPKDVQLKFKPILSQRSAVDLFKRMDTTNFDYSFIEEIFCQKDTFVTTNERYFLNSDRKILDFSLKEDNQTKGILPRYYFYNGKRYPTDFQYYSSSVAGSFFSNLYEYYYTLDTLLFNYANLQPIQPLTYDPTLAASGTKDTSALRKIELENIAIERLKVTYQIITTSTTITWQVRRKRPKR